VFRRFRGGWRLLCEGDRPGQEGSHDARNKVHTHFTFEHQIGSITLDGASTRTSKLRS